jgi:hypothetical protein
MNTEHSLEETATLIGVPPGTLQRWMNKYIFPVGALDAHSEWKFSATDVQMLKGMYETARFGDRTAFVIKPQYRHLLRRRKHVTSKARATRPSGENPGTVAMRRHVQEMQQRWPEVPIRTLLWVYPDLREKYVQGIRDGFLTLTEAASRAKLTVSHLRKRVRTDQKRFPRTLYFKATGTRTGMFLLHPDDVTNFVNFYVRPQGMLGIADAARYVGLHSSTLRNGLREKTLKADAVVDGHIKLFKKETLDTFAQFIRTRVRNTHPKPSPTKPTHKTPAKTPKVPTSSPKTTRKLVLDNGRLVCVNAYGVAEEARVFVRIRKDRGILLLVDAVGCEIDSATSRPVNEALKCGVRLVYDLDGDVVPWLLSD